jgi:hypothetical protein
LIEQDDNTYVTEPCVVENYDDGDDEASGSGEIYEGAGFPGKAPSDCTTEAEGKIQYSFISERDDGTPGTCVKGSTYRKGQDVNLSSCDSRLLEFETCNDELEMGSGFGSGGCGFKYVSHPCVYVNETGEQGDPGCGGEDGCFTSCPVNITDDVKQKKGFVSTLCSPGSTYVSGEQHKISSCFSNEDKYKLYGSGSGSGIGLGEYFVSRVRRRETT